MIKATIEGYILRGDLKRYGHEDVPFDVDDLGTLDIDLFYDEAQVDTLARAAGYTGPDADPIGVSVYVVIDDAAKPRRTCCSTLQNEPHVRGCLWRYPYPKEDS